MEPPGTIVVVHDKPDQNTTWVHHGTSDWYIGPYFYHYRSMKCYMPATGVICITDTLQYNTKKFPSPTTTTEDYLRQADGDILSILKYPPTKLPCLSYGDAGKTPSTKLLNFCIVALSNRAYQSYYPPQCYHQLLANLQVSHLWILHCQRCLRGCPHMIHLQGLLTLHNLQGLPYLLHHIQGFPCNHHLRGSHPLTQPLKDQKGHPPRYHTKYLTRKHPRCIQ